MSRQELKVRLTILEDYLLEFGHYLNYSVMIAWQEYEQIKKMLEGTNTGLQG